MLICILSRCALVFRPYGGNRFFVYTHLLDPLKITASLSVPLGANMGQRGLRD
jgi:hypothetical protein